MCQQSVQRVTSPATSACGQRATSQVRSHSGSVNKLCEAVWQPSRLSLFSVPRASLSSLAFFLLFAFLFSSLSSGNFLPFCPAHLSLVMC